MEWSYLALGSAIAFVVTAKVAEIAISYAGTASFANEIKERLQVFVEKPISVLETGSIIQTHTGENAWAILIRYY